MQTWLRNPGRWGVLVILLLASRADAAGDIQKRFVQARQLLLLERWDQALMLLEGVVPETPRQWEARENLLAEIYQGQKNYGALESLAREALSRDPQRADAERWQFIRGELYLLADHLDSARALLDSIWRVHPTDGTIRRVAALYEQHSVADFATSTYLEARTVIGDSMKFAFELAMLYEARRDYATATQEYFRAIARDSALTRDVENRVLQLVQTEEGGEAIRRELEKAQETPEGAVTARKLLITLYLEEGLPERAWRTSWEVDSISGQAGLTLIMFMRRAAERGYNQVAARAAQQILDAYPTSPVRHQAEWEMAQLAKKSQQWESAREQFRHLATTSPVVRFRLEAALEYGDLSRQYFDELESADSAYVQVTLQQRLGGYYGQALLGRSQIAVQRGTYDSARALLVGLSESEPQGPVREEMTYRLAELDWFEGSFESAQETWAALVADFPQSVWVNDALRYIMLISTYSEAAQADLRAVARAEALEKRRRYDSALTVIAGIRTTTEAPLAPRATLLAARLYQDMERFDSALVLWDGYVESYPRDADAPYALVRAARLCEVELGQPEQAITRYRELLEAYPGSHWSHEARGRMRTLGQF